ncbi:MAG: AmmeMemoRadiSam system radical SAM enzyme [archaeon]
MTEANYYKKLKDKVVQCNACERHCVVKENESGYCKVRKNLKGKLFSLVFGKPVTQGVDPIEKKPFYLFKPGTLAYSFSTFGCNFSCLQCQNYSISKEFNEKMIESLKTVEPKQLVENAIKNDCQSIAFTFVEPTVFVEYALETMKLAKKENLSNVWVSNGYFSREVFQDIKNYLDAINIDLKGGKEFYKKICDEVEVEKVKENIKLCFENEIHLEITNLIIPGLNDSKEDLLDVINFVKSVSPEIGLHFSRFHPCYQLSNLNPTPKEKILQARKLAIDNGLKNVFVGNL